MSQEEFQMDEIRRQQITTLVICWLSARRAPLALLERIWSLIRAYELSRPMEDRP